MASEAHSIPSPSSCNYKPSNPTSYFRIDRKIPHQFARLFPEDRLRRYSTLSWRISSGEGRNKGPPFLDKEAIINEVTQPQPRSLRWLIMILIRKEVGTGSLVILMIPNPLITRVLPSLLQIAHLRERDQLPMLDNDLLQSTTE